MLALLLVASALLQPDRLDAFGYDAIGRMNMMMAKGAATNAIYTATCTNWLTSINGAAATCSIACDGGGHNTSEAHTGSVGVTLAYDGHGWLKSDA
jgi:hypothetical protein